MYMNILRIRCLENNSVRKICSICKIGAECSKCYSYYTYQCDSLMASPNGDKLWDSFLAEADRERIERASNYTMPYPIAVRLCNHLQELSARRR